MLIQNYFFLCVVQVFVKYVASSNILVVMPMPSYSHQIMFRPLWKELLNRGHSITFLSTDPMPIENYTNLQQIDWSFAYEIKYEKYKVVQKMQRYETNLIKFYWLMVEIYDDILDIALETEEVRRLLNDKNRTYDLVIAEYYVPGAFIFSYYLQCPLIGIAAGDILAPEHIRLGNFDHPILYPNLLVPYESGLSFYQRLNSVVHFYIIKYLTQTYYAGDKIIKKYFGDGAPSAEMLLQNISLVFINVDPAFYLRPMGPATIAIGGRTHVQALQPLPKDLKLFMDNAKNGVVYFSLGSSVKSKDLSLETVKTVLEVFQSLPYEVLWKFENDTLPNIPKNVKLAKWLPQQDVLRHPNMKVFITQGGLQSIEEAIFSYVPMVGVPFVGDQRRNVARLQHMGIAVALDKEDLNKKDVFKSAILEVINNPKYKTKIEEVASLSLDQPMTGLEKAVWWTEYVIRHKGAKHLRSPVVDMPAYQYYLLDVLAFLSVTLLVVLFIIYKIIQIIVRLFRKIKLKLKKD